MEEIRQIVEIVSKYYNISPKELCSKSRQKELVNPRQMAHYLCVLLTKNKSKIIAENIGGVNRTTVTHSCSVINEYLEYYDWLRRDVNNLKELFKNATEPPVISCGVAYSFYPKNNYAA